MSMLDDLLTGSIAGAAGTAVLNGSTYADMALRGRAPNELPDRIAGRIAKLVGVPGLDAHRRSGVGALFGYADGIGMGALYALVRSFARMRSPLLTSIALGGATMAASVGSGVALGEAHPRTWSVSKWLSELIPRLLYGLVTCLVFEHFAAREHE
jgi:hypothetical protein